MKVMESLTTAAILCTSAACSDASAPASITVRATLETANTR